MTASVHELRTPDDSEQPLASVRDALQLRVIGGIHTGAVRELIDNEVLVIGSAPDCDVILADDGVAPHHCMLIRRRKKLTVRAVADAVQVARRPVVPGEPVPLARLAPIALGPTAVLAVGPVHAAQWPTATATDDVPAASGAPPSARRRRRRLGWIGGGIAALSVACAAIAAYRFHDAAKPATADSQARLKEVIDRFHLNEVTVSSDAAGKPQIKGVVPSATTQSELRKAVRDEQLPAVVAVRSGDDIAKDVQEVLRLSGINAQTAYVGDGKVEIRGKFGNESQLRAVLASRAVREITGLRQVLAYNAGAVIATPAAAPSDDKRITAIGGSRNPYIVTGDGSRYYPGALLPRGGRLVAIEGQEIVIDSGHGLERMKGAGTRLDADRGSPVAADPAVPAAAPPAAPASATGATVQNESDPPQRPPVP